MLNRLRALWRTEPTRVVSLLVAAIVFAAAKAGVAVDEQAIGEALLLSLPILLGGEVVRSQVSPAEPADTPASDGLLLRKLDEHRLGD